MSTLLELTPHDPLIARDGRPFGIGQGNRMRSLTWFWPSLVAGSFRTALVKANSAWDFTWRHFTETELKSVAVAGVLPVCQQQLYLPAPLDCAWHKETKALLRSTPQMLESGCGTDLPDGLRPVMLTYEQAAEDFKAETPPAWWPLTQYEEWLTSSAVRYEPDWFTSDFLTTPKMAQRDHVALDAARGAAAESLLFASSNLHLTHLPRHDPNPGKKNRPFSERFAEIRLSVRVTVPECSKLTVPSPFSGWYPLGGERRLIHWQACQEPVAGWVCPEPIKMALSSTAKVRLVLATPAIFRNGWKPDLENGPLKDTGLKLVGVCCGRWKAVSGWSLAPPRGPKPTRRMVPAGSVYFFECEPGAAAKLSEQWLHPISDDEQERNDGFGLAVWGIW